MRTIMTARRQRAVDVGLREEVDSSWPLMVHPDTEPTLARRIRDERAANAEEAGVETLLRQLDAIEARPCQHDTLRRLAAAQVPVLVLHGKDDALIPAAEAEAAYATLSDAGASSSELLLLEDTGHFALQERTSEVAHAIAGWWQRAGQ